ncbi:MAG: hypothetical protein FWE38_03730 [Firmicutes bacterium]|nr:hypothetical protein [Bacillota bacterium]
MIETKELDAAASAAGVNGQDELIAWYLKMYQMPTGQLRGIAGLDEEKECGTGAPVVARSLLDARTTEIELFKQEGREDVHYSQQESFNRRYVSPIADRMNALEESFNRNAEVKELA